MNIDKNHILIIMPVYNRDHTVKGAIESIIQQTHQNKTLIIINDGSTDNTREICLEYSNNHNNIIYMENPTNMGVAFSKNKALKASKNLNFDFFTIHDSDDISDVNRLEIILKPFQNNNKLLGLKTTYLRTNMDLEPVLKNGSYDVYSSEGIAIFKREVLIYLGYYKDFKAGEDTDFWNRLKWFVYFNGNKYEIKSDHNILYLARIGNDNLTIKYKDEYPKIYNNIFKTYNNITELYHEF